MAGKTVEALPCNVCKRQARFLTPYGLKCPDHALETAIYHDGGQDWLPIRIRPFIESDIGDDSGDSTESSAFSEA